MTSRQTTGKMTRTEADGTRSVPATSVSATFEFFDPKEDVRVDEGNLPHWYQPGVTYFVTFRTEDSVPKDLSKTWYARRNDWL
jgi:putative transposase